MGRIDKMHPFLLANYGENAYKVSAERLDRKQDLVFAITSRY
jgi:hypothetical protein